MVLGLQTIASRQVNLLESPAVISVGSIHGGVRHNIIPGEVTLEGTIRSFNEDQREKIHKDIKHLVEHYATAANATAKVDIDRGYPALYNNPELIQKMLPTLKRVVGEQGVNLGPQAFGSEDFSYFANETPGFYIWLGATPDGLDPMKVAPNHSPYFIVDEKALLNGVRIYSQFAADFLNMHSLEK